MNTKKMVLFLCMIFTSTSIVYTMNEQKNCSICLDDFDETQCFALPCHRDTVFCVDCYRENITQQINNKEIPHCAAKNCKQPINEIMVRTFFRNDIEALRNYEYFLNEKRTLERISAGIKPCPTPNCVGEFESKSGVRSHLCNVCRQRYCTACEFDHTGMTCQQAAIQEINCRDCNTRHARNISCEDAAQNRIARDQNDNARLLRNRTIQKCPRCNAQILKTGGCNYMTCAQCQHNFCWICLGPAQGHRCLNNNCGIWDADHATRIARQERLIKGAFIVGSVSSVFYIVYSTIYSAWKNRKQFDLMIQAAEQSVEKILTIEFELFDQNHNLFTLEEQCNVESLLNSIASEEKRNQVKVAIEVYDTALLAVYNTISSTKYYHQTPEYFLKHEPQLVEALYARLAELKEILISCQSDISVNWKKFFGMSAVAALGAYYGYTLIHDN